MKASYWSGEKSSRKLEEAQGLNTIENHLACILPTHSII